MSNDSDNPPDAALDGLREELDAIDASILEQIAQRLAIVERIATQKRAEGRGIRDHARERAVLDARVRRAAELGVPKGVVEPIWRLLMLASRERQAAFHPGAVAGTEPKTIAIVGGAGGMGRALERLFGELGHTIVIADVATAIRPVDAAKSADVVVISVPIRATEDVIREIGPHVRQDALLVDITSIKGAPVRAMLAATNASVAGTHPMFGPGVHGFEGQRVVLCPGRGDAWLDWLRRTFASRGMLVTEATADAHDRAMAIVQVLLHYQTQVLGLAIARSGVPLDESLAFTSPAYLLEAYVAARHFAQAPDLYGPIEMLNPKRDEITGTFVAAAKELAEILRSGDQARFDAVFEEVRAYFGDFSDEALEQSGLLIDRLIELGGGRAGRARSGG